MDRASSQRRHADVEPAAVRRRAPAGLPGGARPSLAGILARRIADCRRRLS